MQTQMMEGDNNTAQALQVLQTKVLTLEAELSRVQTLLQFKEEQLRLIHLRKWGPKADKLSPDQLSLLPQELLVTAQEVAKEADLPGKDKQPSKPQAARPNHAGRNELPAHLERREVVIPCKPEDCRCSRCGAERPVIGYETREELDCVPATYFVKVVKREKRGGHCLEEQGVALAPVPALIVPKGKLSNNLVIEVLAAKFRQHNPVYRQCASLLEDHGVDLSRQTLNEAILSAAQLLIPVVKAQAAAVLAGGYVQADETTMPCQTRERSGKNHQAYLWEYGTPGGPVVFQFEMGRGREGPARFLNGFRGVLQSDGYAAYKDLGEGIVHAACMAHIRRKFVEAGKLSPLDPLPLEIVQQISQLYHVEEQARHLDAASRLALRQEKSRPVMDRLRERIMEVRRETTPASVLAKACDYALGQWERMQVFLKDGRVEIDNNWCEGAMRPVALGRKNWLHVGDEKAGPKIAAILSITETCRRLDIPLREYLRDILPRLGDWNITRVAELTPANWKSARKT